MGCGSPRRERRHHSGKGRWCQQQGRERSPGSAGRGVSGTGPWSQAGEDGTHVEGRQGQGGWWAPCKQLILKCKKVLRAALRPVWSSGMSQVTSDQASPSSSSPHSFSSSSSALLLSEPLVFFFFFNAFFSARALFRCSTFSSSCWARAASFSAAWKIGI